MYSINEYITKYLSHRSKLKRAKLFPLAVLPKVIFTGVRNKLTSSYPAKFLNERTKQNV